MSTQFPHIFSPLKVGSVTIPNRLFVSAHHTEFVKLDPSGYREWSVLSERAMHYHADRAKGGFGLIMIGQTQVHPQSGTHRPASYHPQAVPVFTMLAKMVHEAGAKVMVQLNQNGREKTNSGPDAWSPPWGASPTASASPASRGEMSRGIEQDEIDSLIQGFVDSAVLCQQTGMDGVEIHAAHPHMLGEWLTPQANKRTDKYGGSVENRLRIVIEIAEAIRKRVGRDFPVGVRMNGAWPIAGGQTVEEGALIGKLLRETGVIDFLNVSGWPGIGTIGSKLGFMMPWVEAVKKAVPDMPVFGIGRVIHPAQAEHIVAEGQADMVGMTRASIADAELPNKARQGRMDDIRLCIGAAQGCLARNNSGDPMTCTQNPAVGLERDWGIGTVKQAAVQRKVAVVGGGPAGMEAARTLAERGHSVTLYERSDSLGGQIKVIRRVKRRDEFWQVVEWRERQLAKLGATVKLSTEATPELLRAMNADAIVLATGSRPRKVGWYPARGEIDYIPGSDLPHVFTFWEAIEGKLDGKKHIAIVDGTGYHQSTDALEYLLQKKQKISAIAAHPMFGAGVSSNDRPPMIAAARSGDVTWYSNTVVQEILPDSVTATDAVTGKAVTIAGVDAVVMSIGSDVNDDLWLALKGTAPELHRIGDCYTPRGVEHAVYEGHKLGRAI